MKTKRGRSSWVAFGLFYIVLVLIVSLLDIVYDVFRWPRLGVQIGLITVGVGVFVIVGIRLPDLSAARGVLLAFTVGVLTIIPAVLMGLGNIPELWPDYWKIALGMAAGSFLSFLFIRFSRRITDQEQPELERNRFD